MNAVRFRSARRQETGVMARLYSIASDRVSDYAASKGEVKDT